MAVGGERVADARVLGLGEFLVNGVVEALQERLARLRVEGLEAMSTYRPGHGRVRLTVPCADELRRGGDRLGLRVQDGDS